MVLLTPIAVQQVGQAVDFKVQQTFNVVVDRYLLINTQIESIAPIRIEIIARDKASADPFTLTPCFKSGVVKRVSNHDVGVSWTRRHIQQVPAEPLITL